MVRSVITVDMENQQCVSLVLFAYTRRCQQCTVKPVQVSHLSFYSKSPNLYRWPAYGNHLTLRKIELCTITRVNVLYGSECRQVVEEESRYVTLSMNQGLAVQ